MPARSDKISTQFARKAHKSLPPRGTTGVLQHLSRDTSPARLSGDEVSHLSSSAPFLLHPRSSLDARLLLQGSAETSPPRSCFLPPDVLKKKNQRHPNFWAGTSGRSAPGRCFPGRTESLLRDQAEHISTAMASQRVLEQRGFALLLAGEHPE